MPTQRLTVSMHVVIATATLLGCSTTRLSDTSRTGMEQLLVSNAIDRSLDRLDFSSLAQQAVFIDEKYLECVDQKYLIGSLRQRAFESGAQVVEKAEDADIVLEVYSGAVGTDRSEGFVGMPSVQVPAPFPVQLPEIKLWSQMAQHGTAKIGIVAYDARTKQALSSGRLARARSKNGSWSVLGVGPFKTGNLHEEVELAERTDVSSPSVVLSNRAPPRTNDQQLAEGSGPRTAAPPLDVTPVSGDYRPTDNPAWNSYERALAEGQSHPSEVAPAVRLSPPPGN